LGSLLAYIIIGAGFLENFFAPFFDGSQLFYAFAFFIFGALIVFFGKKAVSGVDFLDVFLFIFVLAAILIFGWQSWDLANLSAKTISVSNGLGRFYTIFLPYGVILSALWGATVIPEMEELLGENKRKLRKIVPLGVIIPAIFYLLFIIIAFGISGNTTTAEAISGLKAHLPVFVSSFLFFFGIVVVFTSYVSIGLALRNSLRYDLGINKKIAWLIACFAPFFFYLIGFRNFIKVMGFVGAVALAIEGILIILMYNKVKKRKWGTLPLILILLAGMALEIIYFLK
jgi:amino acid permease